MTAPAPLDLPALLDDLERAQVLAELVAVMHKGWDGSPAVRNWIDEDWERNAEFYLPVVERARARLIAELRKRDTALRAVGELADALATERYLVPEIPRLAAAERIRGAAVLSPESVQS